MLKSLKRFLEDTSGNYAIITAFAIGPILMGVTLAVDYAEINRRQTVLVSSLEAAGIAAAREYQAGTDGEDVKAYAKKFFEANLGKLDPSKVTFGIKLPEETVNGTDIEATAKLNYDPYFYAGALAAMGVDMEDDEIKLDSDLKIAVRLKSTAEIALVLDNSGSMDYTGSGSSQKRITLLKEASKELVRVLSEDARRIQQISKPLQFSIVPFSGSVNVGSQYNSASWMDTAGISPVHHENFDWSTMPLGWEVTKVLGVYRKTGLLWPVAERNQIVTRFTLFNDMKRLRFNYSTSNPSNSRQSWSSGTNFSASTSNRRFTSIYSGAQQVKYANWAGCVEMRPWPHTVTDEEPSSGDPKTLYVPMFAPDEPGDNGYFGTNLPLTTHPIPEQATYSSYNSYFSDFHTNRTDFYLRQAKMGKYFPQIVPQPVDTNPATIGMDAGPNLSCSTAPITPLTETVPTSGETAIKNAIDAMYPDGSTNVTQGIVWGLASISSHEPFAEGRSEAERGNEKIMIVLTDGMNTYYTPSSLSAKDPAANGSIYGSYGYTGRNQPGETKPRLFMGTTSPVTTSLSNSNYSEAMIQHMKLACENAKTNNVRIFTVALDLDYNASDGTGNDKKMAEGLKNCSSYSRLDPDRKLFWNTTGGDLDATFKAIADELSNLRIVG